MTTKKTAISLQQSLFEQVDALARQLHVSRSQVFALAVEEYIQRHQNRKLLAAINAAYEASPGVEEQTLRREMRRQHRQLVDGPW